MAKNEHQQKSPLMFAFGIFLTCILLIILFLPKDTVVKIGERERAAITKEYGEETGSRVKAMADNWYTSAFIDSGILYTTYNFLFDQWENGDNSFDDRGLSKLVENRVDVFWLVLYQVFYRLAASFIWLPFIFPFFIVTVLDGYFEREIRKYRFSYASPIAFRGGARTILISGALLLLAPFMPISMPAQAIPILIGLISMCTWVMVANTQKRL